MTPADEGSLWVLLFPRDLGSTPVVSVCEDAFDHVGDPEFIDGLVHVINGVDAEAALFLAPRASGAATAADFDLWLQLCRRVDPKTELIDLAVVGSRSWVSARSGEELA